MQFEKRQYDVVLWGCTGYTGRLVALVLAKKFGLMNPKMRVALAGRSEDKLREIAELMLSVSLQSGVAANRQRAVELREACEKFSDTSMIPMVILPGYGVDRKSTQEMASNLAKRTSVIIATAGPYAQLGEPILEACVENGTDYIDCTGEYLWVKDMYQRYHEKAKLTKARIIPCCGFAYFLHDIGISELQRHARHLGYSSISEIEQTFIVKGSTVSYGTLNTLISFLSSTPLTEMIRTGNTAAYEMCDEIPTTSSIVLKANNDRLVFPWYSHLRKKWMRPTPLGKGATRYIHWVNQVKGYEYGNNFIYQIGETHTTFLGTLIHFFLFIIGLIFLKSATKCAPLMFLLKRYIANENKKETVTSLAPFEEGDKSVTFFTRGQILQKNENSPLVVEHQINFKNGEAYLMKPKTENNTEEPYGFGPTSHLLKHIIVDTMKTSNFSMSFKLK